MPDEFQLDEHDDAYDSFYLPCRLRRVLRCRRRARNARTEMRILRKYRFHYRLATSKRCPHRFDYLW
jgi:hypothetical protein